jgi:hypothetical protein
MEAGRTFLYRAGAVAVGLPLLAIGAVLGRLGSRELAADFGDPGGEIP